jgi:hypothetical protein
VFGKARIGGAIVVFVCGLAESGYAQWSVGAYAGAASNGAGALTMTRPANAAEIRVADVRFTSDSFESPIYYGYRIGHRVGRRSLWLEGELIHLKVIADPATLRDPIQQFAMTHGMNFVLANVVWMVPLRSASRLSWVIRAGGGATVPHVEATVDRQRDEHYELGGAGFQIAPGASVHVWRTLHATAEYKLTYARPSVDVPGGTISVGVRSQHGAFGLSVIF